MKFSCLQQDIISAIQTVQKVSAKNLSSMYQYIYIEADKYVVKVVATGSDHTAITEFEAQVTEEGRVLAPISLMRDIISKMPNVSVNIDIDDKYVMTLSYIHMKYTI